MFESGGDDDEGDRYADVLVDMPEPTAATSIPSGAVAFELDHETAFPQLLTAAQLVDGIIGYDKLIAWATARQQELIAVFHTRPSDGTIRPAATSPDPAAEPPGRREWAADEIGLALTLAPAAAAARVAQADRFAAVLRPTRDLLTLGRICPARARLVADMLAEYDDDTAAAVQARVLPAAPEQTWGQLRAALTRAIIALVPDPADRHRTAQRTRRVDLYPGRDGMATLSALLTAPEATASFEWITRLARGIARSDDHQEERGRGSMDRRRADVLTALLTGRLVAHDTTHDPAPPQDTAPTTDPSPGAAPATTTGCGCRLVASPVNAHRPLIHITLSLTTLMGLDDEPGELAGYGPLPAPIARDLAADPDSTWRRLLTDPLSGRLLDYGDTTYRPPTHLAGFVRTRDARCRYPGCRRPAAACEIDHVQPWHPTRRTSEDNLCCLCERHHDLKEQPGWQVQLHDDRTLEWTTPTGHHYTTRAADHRVPPPPSTASPPDPPRVRTLEELFAFGPPDPDDPVPF